MNEPVFPWPSVVEAIGHLRRADDLIGQLGRDEQGTILLSWVEVVPRLLKQPALLEAVEEEARTIWQSGIRHIVWSGMGGSVLPVKMLLEKGFCQDEMTMYALDSTDPATLNSLLRAIASAKRLQWPQRPDGTWMQQLLNDVMLISVSLSRTSEESRSHSIWFHDVLEQAHLSPQKHLRILTLPGSMLDDFAREHALSTVSPFLETRETGFSGRMSAPGSRIFLLPVALHFAHRAESGYLEAILRQAWDWYDFALAEQNPANHPFVQLACTLFQASERGVCRLFLHLPEAWQPFLPWVEQLLEQSLGKSGKGIVVFRPQELNTAAPGYRVANLLHIRVSPGSVEEQGAYTICQPYLDALSPSDPRASLAAIAANCLSWQLTMALYAFLCQIPFSTEPAVERYKALARRLRNMRDPLVGLQNEAVLFLRRGQDSTPATIAKALCAAADSGGLHYLDVTLNGEPSQELRQMVFRHLAFLGNKLLGVPVKLRIAPAAYHISEQCQLDGPALVSLRVLVRAHPAALLGSYQATSLCAQAVATWQAMVEAGRPCFLLIVDEVGMPGTAWFSLEHLFLQVGHRLLDMQTERKEKDVHYSSRL